MELTERERELIVEALKRACPAYEPKPEDHTLTRHGFAHGVAVGIWKARQDLADHIGKLIEEYEGKGNV